MTLGSRNKRALPPDAKPPIYIKIKKGLDLPINGQPEETIEEGAPVQSVAICGTDFVGLRPKMLVSPGERVQAGQPLFLDRKNPSVNFTSPGSGRVSDIRRGPKRMLQSVVIELESENERTFSAYPEENLSTLSVDAVRKNLLESGLWTSLRERPYGKVAAGDSQPHSIFVSAMDSNPLAPDPGQIILRRQAEFSDGLGVISRLTEGTVFLCQAPGTHFSLPEVPNLQLAIFDGPHPAGLVGTHIHFLDPVSPKKTVWYLNYQDLIAIGWLFRTGRVDPGRVVALGGSGVRRPRLVQTRAGANLEELLRGDIDPEKWRILSGSVFSGRVAEGWGSYLGRYHNQVTVLPLQEGGREAIRFWPRLRKFTAYKFFLSHWVGRRKQAFTTALKAPLAPMVASGAFEKFVPMDILPTPLLRALLIGDIEKAQALGCLELEEEDLALCSFLCPSKLEYGPLLRSALDRLYKESRG